MNSMVELINSPIDVGADKIIAVPNSKHQSVGTDPNQ